MPMTDQDREAFSGLDVRNNLDGIDLTKGQMARLRYFGRDYFAFFVLAPKGAQGYEQKYLTDAADACRADLTWIGDRASEVSKFSIWGVRRLTG